MGDEFFIGWEAQTAPRLAKYLRRVSLLLLGAALSVAACVSATHGPSAPSRFEFGVERSFEGTLRHAPYPMLLVDRPGGGASTWLVTVFGKSGAEGATMPLDGHRVRVTGSLIHRGGRTMVELLPESLEDLGESSVALSSEELGAATLRGEIVDSKCYLGVMKPGNLKTHRACAVRCISGGVPPVLLVREEGQPPRYVLLADAEGRPVGPQLLAYVAEPIEARGTLSRAGDYEVLRLDVDGLRRE